MTESSRLVVTRHELLFRILHWALFAEGVLLTLSGLQLSGFPGVIIFPGDNTTLHILIGVAFVFTGVALIACMLLTKDYGWIGLRRIPFSLRFILAETRGWFGLAPKPSNPVLYDGDEGRYVEKLVPSVIIVFWVFVLLGVVLALSGLALAYPGQFYFVYLIANPVGGALTGVTGLAFMIVIHRLTTFILVALVAAHIYASVIFGLVRSVITGKKEERVVAPRTGLPDVGARVLGSRQTLEDG